MAHVRESAWLVVWLALLAPASAARADPLEGIRVHWRGPADCPEGSLRADATGLLPSDRKYEPMEIEIAVDSTPDGLRIEMRARSASRTAERTMTLASCDEARKAAALLVALALDPEAVVAKPEAEIGAAPTPAPTPVQPAPPVPSPKPPAPAPRREPASPPPRLAPVLEVSLLAVLEPALLPEPTAGGAAEVGGRIGRFTLAATGLYLFGREGAAPDHAGARAEARLWTAGLALCRFQSLGSAGEIAPCLAGELGDFSAEASGVAHGRQDSALFAAIRLGARYAMPVGPHFALLGDLGVLLPLQRPVMEFRDLGRVHTVPAWSVRGSVGVRFDTGGE